MEKFFIFFLFSNGAFLIVLIIYLITVWLNLIFTFNQLPLTNIPFYQECTPDILGATLCSFYNFAYSTNRYYWLWWFIITDSFLILLPYLIFMNILLVIFNKITNLNTFLAHTLPYSILTALQLIKALMYTIGVVYCADVNFCRNYNSSDGISNPASPNWVYLIMLIFSYIFLIYSFLYLMLKTWLFESLNNFLVKNKIINKDDKKNK
jgi:hypothetical protein